MSFVLSVYSTRAFKEYLLPAVNNADYSLMLSGELFGLSEDCEIRMEIMDGKWKFISSINYHIIFADSKNLYSEENLQNGDVLTISIHNGSQISVVVMETSDFFTVYDKFSLADINRITIGKNQENDFCYNYLNLVSGIHAAITKKGEHFIVEDSSSNGLFVNGRRIVGSYQLYYGDCIDVFGLRIVFLNHFIAVNAKRENLVIQSDQLVPLHPVFSESVNSRAVSVKSIFHRSPRNIPKIEDEKIEIEAPPQPQELNAQPTFMAIGPSMTMALPMLMGCALSIYSTRMNGGNAGAFMYTGLVTAVGSALVGTIWSIVNMRHAKKKNRADELKRFEAYSEYLINCANTIKAKYENNIKGLNGLYPSAATCCEYNVQSLLLWNRNEKHPDFLNQRLGMGSLPFQVEIDIPKERFNLINDSLSEKPKMIKESYKMLHDVPVCVELGVNKIIGIIGGEGKAGAFPVMYDLVAQIAASNCYTDVKLVFAYDETKDSRASMWDFLKWFPHVWSEDKKTRFVAGNKNDASEVFYEITKVLRMRAEEQSSIGSKKNKYPKPYYILFLEDPELLEGELISKYIFDVENNMGITTIMMVEEYEELPNACEFIIENTRDFKGTYGVADGMDERVKIDFDMISPIQLENFARRLSGIEVNEVETGGEIPNVLTFFDMYGIKTLEELNVMDRWKKNRTYDSMRALVGQKAGGADCYLDVHEKYHGPHGLVAGTTGSGKSETLQTYMLSLAVNYSPDDIGFFVIDYKGGGMANLFEGLPHMIGQISNLSGNQVHRAMVSIKSENLRRQRIFNEHGVNNINLYTRLYKNNEAKVPVPHMFIIIDEFAELKREEPDFMRELISVAQVGRSLGVHLILATQKPSGTVDDNIWSNSKFRLCLRVQDRQDSTDMLHRPDAAYITQAGRCYLQVGNDELFELFQSAWSGAVYDEDAGSAQTDIAKMLSENGRAALVGSHAKIKQKEKMKTVWINQLLDILDEAAAEEGYDIAGCIYDSSASNALANRFFKVAEKKNVEYAYSDYNLHRIQDLIHIYSELISEDARIVSSSDRAQIVIKTATEHGNKLPEMKDRTQLDAIVEYLAKVAEENGYVHNLQLWLPVLPEILYLHELNGYRSHSFNGNTWPERAKGFSLETMIGLYDDPVNQAQRPLTVDVAVDGNHAIIGTVTSGKSTLLMSYLYSLTDRYTPDAVNIYILDYSSKMLGALEGMPHVGGVMYENDDEKVSKFFTMMEGILQERKTLFKGGSYSQYIQANGLVVPAVIIVIDNMASFRSKTNNIYEDQLMSFAKEGVGYGIFMMISAAGFGLSEIPSRLGDNFRSVICLEMNDKFSYTDALRTLHLDVLPEENVKGRGIAKVGDAVLEFQTALTVPAEDDYKRAELIKAHCEKMRQVWTGKCAKSIPKIPEKPVWTDFKELDDVNNMAAEGFRLPIGYDKKNATIYGIDLRKTYCYMFSGKGRSGKTNALRIAIASAQKVGGQIAVIDFSGELKLACDLARGIYVNTEQDLFNYFNSITDTFKARNVRKRQYITEGLADEEIFDKMQEFEKIFIFIADLADFVSHVHNPGEGIGQMASFVTTLLEKGSIHNVFWFAAYNHDDSAKAIGMSVYNAFIKDKNGMHFGGNIAAQHLMTFDHIPYMEQSKTVKPGIGMLPTHESDDTTMVVLPLFRTEQTVI